MSANVIADAKQYTVVLGDHIKKKPDCQLRVMSFRVIAMDINQAIHGAIDRAVELEGPGDWQPLVAGKGHMVLKPIGTQLLQ